jgi:tripartite-type tricarboxylate transporter receptor subunit TctC
MVKRSKREDPMPVSRLRAALIAACAILVSASCALAADPFYKGKRLTLVINFAAGGPSDIEGRLLAKHTALR